MDKTTKELRLIAMRLGISGYGHITRRSLLCKIKDESKRKEKYGKLTLFDMPDEMIYEICDKMHISDIFKFIDTYPQYTKICYDAINKKEDHLNKKFKMIVNLLKRMSTICKNYSSQNREEQEKSRDIMYLFFDVALEFINESEYTRNIRNLERTIYDKIVEFAESEPEIKIRYPQMFEDDE